MTQFIPANTAFDFWRPFVKRLALCYRTVVCPVCPVLSVCDVCVLWCQTVGGIKMELGMQVGLGPGHIVSDGDPAPSPKRGTASNFLPISVVAK